MTTGFKSYADAVTTLPCGAVWSSSFGYPGQGGYCEIHRHLADGRRWEVCNGSYLDSAPFTWTVKPISPVNAKREG